MAVLLILTTLPASAASGPVDYSRKYETCLTNSGGGRNATVGACAEGKLLTGQSGTEQAVPQALLLAAEKGRGQAG